MGGFIILALGLKRRRRFRFCRGRVCRRIRIAVAQVPQERVTLGTVLLRLAGREGAALCFDVELVQLLAQVAQPCVSVRHAVRFPCRPGAAAPGMT